MVVRFAQRSNGNSTSMNQLVAGWIYRFLGARLWRPFSQVVFPIYLFHFPMVAIAGALTFQTLDLASIKSVSLLHLFSIFIIASTLSLGLGIILHVTIEQPMIRIGANYLRGKTPPLPKTNQDKT